MPPSKKVRRHNGRIYPQSTIKAKQGYIINECLEPQPFWDDWEDYRDGFRGYRDRTKLRPRYSCFSEYFEVRKWNKKIKRKNKIRKARKNKKFI